MHGAAPVSVLDAVGRRSLRSCRWALVMPGQMLCACVCTRACLSRTRVLARLLEKGRGGMVSRNMAPGG